MNCRITTPNMKVSNVAKRKEVCKRSFLVSILMLSMMFSAVFLTACDGKQIMKEGIVVEMVYGNPVIKEIGSIKLKVVGEADFYFRVEGDSAEFQWFRAKSVHYYKVLKVGEKFVFDESKFVPINSILD